jgi:predicted CXXCH cytochrome family protein
MSVDKSTDLCGRCHNDPRFGEQWMVSAHYQRNISCTTCHDPHSAGFKPVPGQEKAATDPSGLCLNCHKDYSESAVHSRHGQVGVTCVNCHLGVTDEVVSDPHQLPNHSFKPVIATCNSCHSQQMHAEGESAGGSAVVAETGEQSANPVQVDEEVTDEPAPVSPLGFALMAGLVGLAFGIVLAPWLEKAYQRWSKGGK